MSLTAEQAQALLDYFSRSFNELQSEILKKDGVPSSGNPSFSEVRKQFIPNILLALNAIAKGQDTFEPTMLINIESEKNAYFGIFTPQNMIVEPNSFLSHLFENHRYHDIFSRLTELFNNKVSLAYFDAAVLYPDEMFIDGVFRLPVESPKITR